MKTALVVGGTGPTGPFIVNGLRARGYKVAILHRGTHEIDEIPADVEHIHTDPHFKETLTPALAGRNFDLCVASYGRTRYVAEVMAGKCARFIAAGGMTYRAAAEPGLVFPRGGAVMLAEDDPQPTPQEHKFVSLIGHTERVIHDFHPGATIFRYPYVYGPHQLVPREWSILRRLRDGRQVLALPEGGLSLTMHGYAENVAAAVLLGVDRPGESAGKSYNCGDSLQFSLNQIVQILAREMGVAVEVLSIPAAVAGAAYIYLPHDRSEHLLADLFRLRAELGYRDVVAPEEAFIRTARWLLAHPPPPGGQVEQALGDAFDYALEDAQVAALRAALTVLAPFAATPERHHAYAHPKTPGQADHRNR